MLRTVAARSTRVCRAAYCCRASVSVAGPRLRLRRRSVRPCAGVLFRFSKGAMPSGQPALKRVATAWTESQLDLLRAGKARLKVKIGSVAVEGTLATLTKIWSVDEGRANSRSAAKSTPGHRGGEETPTRRYHSPIHHANVKPNENRRCRFPSTCIGAQSGSESVGEEGGAGPGLRASSAAAPARSGRAISMGTSRP